ncbi:MAG: TRAP transporter large permease [Chloroflexi bacterium]|nr:TRAP transporter large permease [Chloroflexota bacterium]
MEWQFAALIVIGGLVALMALGLETVFCFMLIGIIGALLLWGGERGLNQLILSLRDSISDFSYLTVAFFIFMGEVIFVSGVARNMIDTLDMWIGRLPGRLGLLAIAGGTVFACLSGSSMGGTALLGSSLIPEMEKRGYQKPMCLGPILGSGGLAMLIPPTSLGVILAILAQMSIGQFFMAIVVPGLLVAALMAIYVIARCKLQPQIAPSYRVTDLPLSEKLMAAVRYILPLGLIVFLVLGIIFLGIATPTEAAAMGALGSLLLAALYRQLDWGKIKRALFTTIEMTSMVLIILTSAQVFSQILVFTGISKGLSGFISDLSLSPIGIIIITQLIILVMGMFMSQVPIMMITIPMFMPIVRNLGFDPIWFGAITLLNLEIAGITPPFGLNLFVMKGVAPQYSMQDVYRAGLPFVYVDLIAMAFMFAFPQLSLWLPSLMFKGS